MAIKTKTQSIASTSGALTLHYGIETMSGSAVQAYNATAQEYEPDRSVVPLILQAYVSVSDPEGMMKGRLGLDNVEWYEGMPKADLSNRITANTIGYEIGDGTVTGFPKYALKVKKNTPVGQPLQVFCIAKYTDTRKGLQNSVEINVPVYSMIYETENFKLKLDCPQAWGVNALRETRWTRTLTAQLYKGKTAVPDNKAAYWWQVKEEDGSWRSITSDDEKVWITCRSGGRFVKTLTFDARLFQHAAFRVRAAYYEDTRPSAPTNAALVAETAVATGIPHTLNVRQRQTRGARMDHDFGTIAGYTVDMYDNRKDVDDTLAEDLFRVAWKAKSTASGASEVSLGGGRNIEFKPNSKGFNKSYPVDVWAEVSVYSKHAVLADDEGNYVTDSDGKIIIVPNYE